MPCCPVFGQCSAVAQLGRMPGNAGMPSWTVVACRRRAASIWVSLSSAPARLTFSPSASPGQPSRSASAMRSCRFARISCSRARWAGSGRRSEHLMQALVDAWRAEGAGADADRQLAFFEVGEELVPFLLGRCPVFLAGAGLPAAGDERAVGFDGFGRVDRLVTHRGADIAVAAYDLGDVRRQPVHDRVGDEDPAKIMGGEDQRLAVVAADAGAASARWRISRSAPSLMGRCSPEMARWNSSGRGGFQVFSWVS